MISILLRCYIELVVFDVLLWTKNFQRVYNQVRNCPVAPHVTTTITTGKLCRSMDLACVFYWKKVLCLQRSAATARLLRRYGIPASLIIGAKQMPFRAHAWVELDGSVVNDKAYVRDIYLVLDRC
jgi:Transglutaminase-like superfamily